MNLVAYTHLLNEGAFVNQVSPKIEEVCQKVFGFSRPNLMQVISLAVGCMEPDELYLEIGSWQGRTLIGALVDHPETQAVAVDNFSLFAPEEAHIPQTLQQNLQNFGMTERVHFHEQDSQAFLREHTELHGKVGVYFYDGDHGTLPALENLKLALPYLAQRAVIVIDDTSGTVVWRTIARFCAEYEDQTNILFAMATPDLPFGNQKWHNGIVVLAWNTASGYNEQLNPTVIN